MSVGAKIKDWKGIAAYLDVTESTAKGWAQHKGLTVYVLIGCVYAFKADLDAFLAKNTMTYAEACRQRSTAA